MGDVNGELVIVGDEERSGVEVREDDDDIADAEDGIIDDKGGIDADITVGCIVDCENVVDVVVVLPAVIGNDGPSGDTTDDENGVEVDDVDDVIDGFVIIDVVMSNVDGIIVEMRCVADSGAIIVALDAVVGSVRLTVLFVVVFIDV